MRQFLLQSVSGITKCVKMYYKVRQVLQSVALLQSELVQLSDFFSLTFLVFYKKRVQKMFSNVNIRKFFWWQKAREIRTVFIQVKENLFRVL